MNFLRKKKKESSDKRGTFINNCMLSRRSDQKEKDTYTGSTTNSNLSKEKLKINHISSNGNKNKNSQLDIKESVDSFWGKDNEEEEEEKEKNIKASYDNRNASINNNINNDKNNIHSENIIKSNIYTSNVDRTFSRQNESTIKPIQRNISIRKPTTIDSRNTFTNETTKKLSSQHSQNSNLMNHQSNNITVLSKTESVKTESNNGSNINPSRVSNSVYFTPTVLSNQRNNKIASSSVNENIQKKEQYENNALTTINSNVLKKKEEDSESKQEYQKSYTKDMLSSFSLNKNSTIEYKSPGKKEEKKTDLIREVSRNCFSIVSRNSISKENKNEKERLNSRSNIESERRNTHTPIVANEINRKSVLSNENIPRKEETKEIEPINESIHQKERVQNLDKKSILLLQRMSKEYSFERKEKPNEITQTLKEQQPKQQQQQQQQQRNASISLNQVSVNLKKDQINGTSIHNNNNNNNNSRTSYLDNNGTVHSMEQMKTQKERLNDSLEKSNRIKNSRNKNSEELLKESKNTLKLSKSKSKEEEDLQPFELDSSRDQIQNKESNIIDSNYHMKDLINNKMDDSLLESTNSLLESCDITKEIIHIEIDPISIEVNTTRTSTNIDNTNSVSSSNSRMSFIRSNNYQSMNSSNIHRMSEGSMKESTQEGKHQERENYRSSLLSHFNNNFETSNKKRESNITESLNAYQHPTYDYKNYKTYIYNDERNKEVIPDFEKNSKFIQKRNPSTMNITYETSSQRTMMNSQSTSKHYEPVGTSDYAEGVMDNQEILTNYTNSSSQHNQTNPFNEPLAHDSFQECLKKYERENYLEGSHNSTCTQMKNSSPFSNNILPYSNTAHSLNISEISVSNNSQMTTSSLEEINISQISDSNLEGSSMSSRNLQMKDLEIDEHKSTCEGTMINNSNSNQQRNADSFTNFSEEKRMSSKIKHMELQMSYIENDIQQKIREFDKKSGDAFEDKCNTILERIEKLLGGNLLTKV